MPIEIVTTQNRLNELADDWNQHLHPYATYPTQLFSWLNAAAALHPPGSLRILVDVVDGQLNAAAPLAMRRIGGIRRLIVPGSHVLGEPDGLIYRDSDFLQRILAALTAIGTPIQLNPGKA